MKFPSRKNKKIIFKTGFTLIETLVAISILLIAITGPLGIVASSLKSSYFARDQITAFYLAQEGLEFVRNFRDTNSLKNLSTNTSWLTDSTPSSPYSLGAYTLNSGTYELNRGDTRSTVYTMNGYDLNSTNSGINLTSGAFGDVYYDSTNGFYGCTSTDISCLLKTQFNRQLTIIVNATSTQITSTVTWMNYGSKSTFSLNDTLLNWQTNGN